MKKLYILFIALCGAVFSVNSQSVVLVNTDWSDLDPKIANNTAGTITDNYKISTGTFNFKGAKYNDLTNMPSIGTVGGGTVAAGTGDAVVMNPANDATIRYVRVGTTTTLVDNVPSTHFYQVTPTNAFVNGGKITLVVSVNATGKGINVYNMTDKVLLGTINISGITTVKYETVTFNLPTTLSGIKTIGFCRAEIDGSLTAPVTFFTWKVKMETFDVGTSTPTISIGDVISTQYYSLTGALVATKYAELAPGIYLQKSTFDNGTVTTVKISKTKQ